MHSAYHTTQTAPYLMWFRQDLRILDNTAFYHCCEAARATKAAVLAVVYLTPQQWQQHDKSLWQTDLILRRVVELKQSLAELQIGLMIRVVNDFDAQQADLLGFCQQHAINQVFANIEYLVNEQQRDIAFNDQARDSEMRVYWYHDECILPPCMIRTDKDTAYKVFTPFYKRWLAQLDIAPVQILPIPQPLNHSSIELARQLSQAPNLTIERWVAAYYPADSAWQNQLANVAAYGQDNYPVGDGAILQRLADFIAEDIQHYDTARDVPAWHDTQGATSQLSPYLAIGALSARLCYVSAITHLAQYQGQQQSVLRWVSELAWRDFYRDGVVNRPDMVKGQAFLAELDQQLPWQYDKTVFEMWCQGNTGVPLVDAAMRCLNTTGFMHNRLRMVVAMYLTKNLLIDWRWGERYFMQHLVDGDFASNNGGWQWSASVGTDAQPYFRVMNPFSQAASYDPDCIFIKRWLPELTQVPANILIHEEKFKKYLLAHQAIDYPTLPIPTKVTRARGIQAFKTGRIEGL
jgi:deoxyribodipyrimidine photo-lyase